jgi:hypothetical protein
MYCVSRSSSLDSGHKLETLVVVTVLNMSTDHQHIALTELERRVLQGRVLATSPFLLVFSGLSLLMIGTSIIPLVAPA